MLLNNYLTHSIGMYHFSKTLHLSKFQSIILNPRNWSMLTNKKVGACMITLKIALRFILTCMICKTACC